MMNSTEIYEACAKELEKYLEHLTETKKAKEVLNIISCKDCQYWTDLKQWSAEGGELGNCHLNRNNWQENEFCSRGISKTKI